MPYEGMDKASLKAKIKAVKAEIDGLALAVNAKIKENQCKSPMAPDGQDTCRLKKRRALEGHFGKIVSLCWVPGSDSSTLMTSAQDGYIITWNAEEQKKKTLTQLKSPWVMFAEAYNPEICASGGLDNVCTVWKMPATASERGKITHTFKGHQGYVCNARWVDGTKLLTTSGDNTAALWDLGKTYGPQDEEMQSFVFEGHDKDVTSLDFKPGSTSEFATSSADGSMMLWGLGTKGPLATMRLYQADLGTSSKNKALIDVNKVKFQSGGTGLACATEMMGSFLYDVRTLGAINTFNNPAPGSRPTAKTSCAFSKSGRLLFVAAEDMLIEVWDTLQPDAGRPASTLSFHDGRVTDVGVPESGTCVASCSWDATGAVWAP